MVQIGIHSAIADRGALRYCLLNCKLGDVTATMDDTIKDLLTLIERGLGEMSDRQLVSTSEVSDLLLDMRGLVMHLEPEKKERAVETV